MDVRERDLDDFFYRYGRIVDIEVWESKIYCTTHSLSPSLVSGANARLRGRNALQRSLSYRLPTLATPETQCTTATELPSTEADSAWSSSKGLEAREVAMAVAAVAVRVSAEIATTTTTEEEAPITSGRPAGAHRRRPGGTKTTKIAERSGLETEVQQGATVAAVAVAVVGRSETTATGAITTILWGTTREAKEM